MQLLSSLDIRRDQANVVDAGATHAICGTRASNPCGTLGAITMKMMIRTSKTSIRGTMFGSDSERFPLPTVIPMQHSRPAKPSKPAAE
jgi:hypothetical protein